MRPNPLRRYIKSLFVKLKQSLEISLKSVFNRVNYLKILSFTLQDKKQCQKQAPMIVQKH